MHILLDRHSSSLFIHFNLIISLLSRTYLTSSLQDFTFVCILRQQTAQDSHEADCGKCQISDIVVDQERARRGHQQDDTAPASQRVLISVGHGQQWRDRATVGCKDVRRSVALLSKAKDYFSIL